MLFLSITYIETFRRKDITAMVGPSRLELPTSRLSSGRSNQLS